MFLRLYSNSKLAWEEVKKELESDPNRRSPTIHLYPNGKQKEVESPMQHWSYPFYHVAKTYHVDAQFYNRAKLITRGKVAEWIAGASGHHYVQNHAVAY